MSSESNFAYAFQYQTAYEILYNSSAAVDTISLPMLYNMRHYLELALKANIDYFSEFSGSRNMVGKTVHSLTPLSNAFLEHWSLVKKKFGVKVDDKNLVSDFSLLISKLDEIDSYAISFRYSHDREQNKNFDWLDTIDIHHLNSLLKNTTTLLYHSVDVFEDFTGLMHGHVTKDQLLNSVGTP